MAFGRVSVILVGMGALGTVSLSVARADGGAGGRDVIAGQPVHTGGQGYSGDPGQSASDLIQDTGGGGGGAAGGGNGGNGSNFVGGRSLGGAGGTALTPDGQAGQDNSNAYGGGGGGGGYNGINVGNLNNTVALQGGNGGRGGNGDTAGGGGGGGGGGYGAVVTGSGTSQSSSDIVGGNGGAGGIGGASYLGAPSPPANNPYNANGGAGGDGGVGVRFTSPGAVFYNFGTVAGGNGGTGGGKSLGGAVGLHGAGGAGIIGSDLTVINSGTISGGFAGDGTTRANAITFTGGTNNLTITSTSVINGNVVAASSADTLGLAGAGNGTFDLSQLGPIAASAQYQGFGILQKSDTGVWTVTGTPGTTLAYQVTAGTLDLNGTNQTVASLLLTGGTIQNGTLTGAGLFDTQAGTISANLAGTGALMKSTAGTVTLAGTNTYTGGTTIAGGVLSVSSDANLGAVSGGLVFAGGSLATTGTFDTARTVSLIGNGTFDIAPGTALGLTGQVAGAGDLVKLGAGALRLGGSGNSYGNTLVQAGTLIGNTATISGNIGNAGTVVFDQSADASFAGQVLGLNGQGGAMAKQGPGRLTLTGMSSLDWTVEAGALVSSAERFGGNAAIASGASLTFEQSANASYAGVLSGNGGFNKTGASALGLTGDSSGFAGTTTIEAGTLAVNGKLGGTLDVLGAGRLQGNGTVGNTVVSGTIAPGNSIGVLNVAGNIMFNQSSIYEVEVNAAGQSDKIAASGSASINGGTVQVLAGMGNYALRTQYSILTASGGIVGLGRFDGVTSNLAFLTPSLGYDGQNVFLTMTRNDVAFARVGITRNQTAAGSGVESLGFGNPLYDAVLNLSGGQARRAFDQLSGEIHGSAKTALIEDSRFVRDAAIDRTRGAFGGAGAPSMPIVTYGAGGVRAVAPTYDRLAVWGQGFGNWGHSGNDGNAAKVNRTAGGFLMGADTPVFDIWRLGLMGGYGRTTFDAKDRASSGWSDNYHLGLYGGTQWGALGLRTGVAYTWHDLSTRRSVIFPGFSDRPTGSYRAGTFQAFGDLGYRIDTGLASFEPFANLAYVSLQTDGFAERGGASALYSRGQTTEATFTTLGLRASTIFTFAGLDTTLRGTLGWRHAFGDVTPLSTQAYMSGSAFTVAGVPIARDATIVEAGIDLNLTQALKVGLAYNGQIASKAQDHGIRANLKLAF